MSEKRLTQHLLLPDLRFVKETYNNEKRVRYFYCEKVSKFEVCPHCATKCTKVYDRVNLTVKDTPIRNKNVFLVIQKRRFKCESCRKVFREPIGGIRKGFRTTERLRVHIRWCASNFANLSCVSATLRCSDWLVYKAFYEQAELELRKYKSPWPKTLGIDEHSFLRNQRGSKVEFVTVFVDYTNKRMKEVVLGKAIGDLHCDRVKQIPGRENVKNVITDLSPTFRSFVKDFFPNARIIADHFHVVKLMHPLIHQMRKETIEKLGIEKRRKNPIVRLLLTYRKKLQYHQRSALDKFLKLTPELEELYWYQQRLYRIYKIKGYNKAKKKLIELTDEMCRSKNKRIVSYRNTLRSWHEEILNYFSTGGLNNGRTEGYNRKAKLIQRCAYGFRSFKNYRLKLLYCCR
jgi:transposase